MFSTTRLRRRLALAATWSLLGATVARGSTLLSMIVLARILGPEGFGQLGISQLTVGMFGALAGSGFGLAATRNVAALKGTNPDGAGRVIGTTLLAAVGSALGLGMALAAGASWFSRVVLAAPDLSDVVRLSSVLLVISAISSAQQGTLLGLEAFRRMAAIDVVAALAGGVSAVLGAGLSGVSGALTGLLVGGVCRAALGHITLRAVCQQHGIRIGVGGGDDHGLRTLLGFSMPAIVSGTLGAPANWACGAILVNAESGYFEMAIFQAANYWRTVILFLPSTLSTMMLPLKCEAVGLRAQERHRAILSLNALMNAVLGGAAALGTMIAAPWIMAAYGSEFKVGDAALTWMAVSGFVVSLQYVTGHAMVSVGAMWRGLGTDVLWGVSLVSLAWLFVANGTGAAGLAVAYALAALVQVISQVLVMRTVRHEVFELASATKATMGS
jgi:O-antigen/teichoic acid export membrane protein